MENGKINAVKDKTGNKFKIAKIILISILLFITTPLILFWIVCTPCPWGWGFIKPEDTGAWLGFYGAVLGGCITIWRCMVDNKKSSKHKKRRYNDTI